MRPIPRCAGVLSLAFLSASILLPLDSIGQQRQQPLFRLPFGPAQTQNVATSDMATQLWTQPMQSTIDQIRANICPVLTVEHLEQTGEFRRLGQQTLLRAPDAKPLPPIAQAIVKKVGTSKGYSDNQPVSAIEDQLCAPEAIARALEQWSNVTATLQSGPLPLDELIQKMPPDLMCFADDATIGAYLKQFPMRNEPSGRTSYWMIDGNFQNGPMHGVIQAAAQSWSPSCNAYYEKTFFRPYVERADARKRALDRIHQIYNGTGIAVADQVIWENYSAKEAVAPRGPFGDAEQLFNELNIAIQREAATSQSKQAFAPPAKGEFEKTVDYDARVQQARQAFEADRAKIAQQASAGFINARQQLFREFLGAPEITDLKYDADREQFSLTVSSKIAPFMIAATLPVQASEAPTLKSQIATGTVHVLLGLANGKLTVASLVFWPGGDKVYGGTIADFTKSPIAFGDAAAEQWPKTLVARQADRQMNAALRAQQYAEKVRQDAKTNPFVAQALHAPLRQGQPCDSLRAQLISFAGQPGISPATWSQFWDRVMDTADRAHCL